MVMYVSFVSRVKERERVWHKKSEMRIIEVRRKCFQKSPIQEYGKRATFASLVHQGSNTLTKFITIFFFTRFFLRVFSQPSLIYILLFVFHLKKYHKIRLS